MLLKRFILGFILIIVWQAPAMAQNCTTLGQTPETAFPVCGTTSFIQNTVPICTNGSIIVPGCESQGSPYPNKNPFWYKFTCFQSGSLNFTITPLSANEDYDWQLFDITGLPPNIVFTMLSAIVTGNWSGSYGATGTSSTGVPFIQCGSNPADNAPRFALSPNIIQGHNYILLISHFTDTQSGYTLSFGGGTSVITDPNMPHLGNARAACDGTVMYVTLNKKMKCSSLAADGSDFSISTGFTTIINAVGVGCSNGFDTDSLALTLGSPLPPGTYTLTIKNGADGNTLKDNCDRNIPVGETVDVTVFPIIPTPVDSLTKPGCSPQTLQLVFKKPIFCNSIAADGSDFSVTGSYPVVVSGASGNCGPSGLSNIITVQLSAPLQVAGNFQISLQIGSDGNTILDECAQPSVAGSSIAFAISDTVNADFTYNILYGCKADTVNYSHDGRNGINSWLWNFDNVQNSTLQNVQRIYKTFGQKQTRLYVSNGVCEDTSQELLILDNYLKAAFSGSAFVCPQDPAEFTNQSVGNIVSWLWNFGNGTTSTLQAPPPQNYAPGPTKYNALVTLTVTNNIGCTDTVKKNILVIENCYIAVPSAFSPNGDGLNDFLYPLNAYKSRDLAFAVYNRFGQRIFYTNNWQQKWDGRFNGQAADPGTYVWMLSYTNTDTNQKVDQKGTVVLIR
ncbi:MAG: gliding motility-associated C-terminal domain-containing protein [Ferruginibacter sp.]